TVDPICDGIGGRGGNQPDGSRAHSRGAAYGQDKTARRNYRRQTLDRLLEPSQVRHRHAVALDTGYGRGGLFGADAAHEKARPAGPAKPNLSRRPQRVRVQHDLLAFLQALLDLDKGVIAHPEDQLALHEVLVTLHVTQPLAAKTNDGLDR